MQIKTLRPFNFIHNVGKIVFGRSVEPFIWFVHFDSLENPNRISINSRPQPNAQSRKAVNINIGVFGIFSATSLVFSVIVFIFYL